MSSTIASPTTVSSAIPTASPTSSSSGKTDIPGSTVISIGLGFVAFAVFLLFLLMLSRLYRIRVRIRQARSSGVNITFAEAWEREGRLFGFLTGLGTDNYLPSRPSADMQERLERLRRRQEFLMAYLSGQVDRPKIWDIPVQARGSVAKEDSDYKPFSLGSTKPPLYTDRAKPATELPEPLLSLSLLISMPCEPSPPKRLSSYSTHDDVEDWADLPEVMIGVTDVRPMIQVDEEEEEDRGSIDKPVIGSTGVKVLDGVKEKGTVVAEVQELEYRPGSIRRRARWAKAEMGRWRIEGL